TRASSSATSSIRSRRSRSCGIGGGTTRGAGGGRETSTTRDPANPRRRSASQPLTEIGPHIRFGYGASRRSIKAFFRTPHPRSKGLHGLRLQRKDLGAACAIVRRAARKQGAGRMRSLWFSACAVGLSVVGVV